MNEIKHISSLQNPLVKKLLLLKEKSRERKKHGLFILEGQRELRLALKGNYEVSTLFFYSHVVSLEEVEQMVSSMQGSPEVLSVSKEVYHKMAYRETTEGIIAICKTKGHSLMNLSLKGENPLILVAQSPEKPGNMGALLRTADAANLDAVIIADPIGDLYNPNIVRSSVGCIFTNSVATGTTEEVIAFLKSKNVKIYCAALSASKNYTDTDFTGATAIVVGPESIGLSEEWLNSATQNIVIPMQGEIDSMNVSVSAAILIFEAKRQRRFL
ncbi:MAG: TrmH family RNA methyltransferase [Flavobacteriaceae bacterium]